jgi:signal transduction histidine kinase
MLHQMKEILQTIVRNRALGLVVLTFLLFLVAIVSNILINRDNTISFTTKVEETDRLYKTQNLIAKLEQKLTESERTRRQLITRFNARVQDYKNQDAQINGIGLVLVNQDSSSLNLNRRNELEGFLKERSRIVQKQLDLIKNHQPTSQSLLDAGYDNQMALNNFTERVRMELSQSLQDNIRMLRRKVVSNDQYNVLFVLLSVIASIFATTLTTQDFLRQKQIESILRSLNDEKSKLFSILGHDLRSPLSGLNGIIYILKKHRKEMSDEDLDEAVNQLEITSQNYSKLLEDVLTWSRLQLNKIPIEFQDLNAHQLVNETNDLYAEQVQKKKIWIHNQVPEGLKIHSDKGMLQVVLRNLISNAIKFTREGGDIWVNYRNDRDFHYLDVKDTGVGMSDAILRTLFTNSTISMAGTNNESGTGLGLSICKEFLSKDDGFLSVESVPGKGSMFTVGLPMPETRKRLLKERRKSPASRD